MKAPEAQSGFTLIEALAAVAIIAAILGALAGVSGQWLPNWRRGFEALQNADVIAQSLDRIVADLSSAEYARLDPKGSTPLFRGDADAVMFVRAASGPNAGPRLEYVRIGARSTKDGLETQRSRADFAPGPIGPFRDAATLLRPPFRLKFAYQQPNGGWASSWGGEPTLPRSIRLTVMNGAAVAAATAFLLKATSGPEISSQQAPTTEGTPEPETKSQ